MSRTYLKASLALWLRRHAYRTKRRSAAHARNDAAGIAKWTKLQEEAGVNIRKRRDQLKLGVVAPPLKHVLASSWGWVPGVHDGVDIICPAKSPVFAICDGTVFDVRAGGWWGKAPSGNVSLGDGIIQIRSDTAAGPFERGQHFGYGHAEGAVVKVGDKVKAGQLIGYAGLAVAWHIHFMVNDGETTRGKGTRNPRPFLDYAQRSKA